MKFVGRLWEILLIDIEPIGWRFYFCFIFGDNSNYFKLLYRCGTEQESRKCAEISILLLSFSLTECVCVWLISKIWPHHAHCRWNKMRKKRWRMARIRKMFCGTHFVLRMRSNFFAPREIQFCKYKVYGTRGRYFVCRFALCRNAHHVLFAGATPLRSDARRKRWTIFSLPLGFVCVCVCASASTSRACYQ